MEEVFSEVVLGSFLGLYGVQDGLSLGLVPLVDLLDLLFHLGVQGGQPRPQLLHAPRPHLPPQTHHRVLLMLIIHCAFHGTQSDVPDSFG